MKIAIGCDPNARQAKEEMICYMNQMCIRDRKNRGRGYHEDCRGRYGT